MPDIRDESDKSNDEIEDVDPVVGEPTPEQKEASEAIADPLDRPVATGRYKVIPTEREIQYVERLVALGLPQKYQAAFLKIPLPTYEKFLKEHPEIRDRLRNVEAKVIGNVAKTAYNMAVSGENPSMTMFFLKSRAGWRDRQIIQHEGTVKLEDIVGPTFEREKKDKPNDEK